MTTRFRAAAVATGATLALALALIGSGVLGIRFLGALAVALLFVALLAREYVIGGREQFLISLGVISVLVLVAALLRFAA